MAYVPKWESLDSAIDRVMAFGYSRFRAKRAICAAIVDKGIRIRRWVEWVETPGGARLLDLRLLAAPSSLIGSLRVPLDLTPGALDWRNSGPKRPWISSRRFSVQISKLEVFTLDVIRVLGNETAMISPERAADSDSQEEKIEPVSSPAIVETMRRSTPHEARSRARRD